MSKSELVFNGSFDEMVEWLNENVDQPPAHVQSALEDFIRDSTDEIIQKGASKWACSLSIGRNRKLMHDSNEVRPVLVIHYIAWPPIEMLEKAFGVSLQGERPSPEHLKWIQDQALQYVCGLIVEEGNWRRVVEFMTTFRAEDKERAAQATQDLLAKFKKQGE